jgi:hypothetical protein
MRDRERESEETTICRVRKEVSPRPNIPFRVVLCNSRPKEVFRSRNAAGQTIGKK